MASSKERPYLGLTARTVIFVLYIIGAYLCHGAATGLWQPGPGGESLWLMSALGLLSFRLLAAPYFVHPKDSFATSLTGFFIVWAIDLSSSQVPTDFFLVVQDWAAGILAVVAGAGGLAIILKDVDETDSPIIGRLRRESYWFNVTFGTGEIVFTVPALIGIFAFYPWQFETASILTLGWVLIATVKPLEAFWLSWLRSKYDAENPPVRQKVGEIQRIDTPNLVRVALTDSDPWEAQDVHLVCLADGAVVEVLPLFAQFYDEGLIGTGLLVRRDGGDEVGSSRMNEGGVYQMETPPARSKLLQHICSFPDDSQLVGLVVERSEIGSVKFEAASEYPLEEGNVVFCEQRDRTVFYQIVGVETAEETFERNPLGRQVITAAQLGYPDDSGGFKWYSWVPEMNTPVFVPTGDDWGQTSNTESEEDEAHLVLGQVPGTSVDIRADFGALAEYHTAVLGTTGMGKTELVFDIIRHGLTEETHIICIDFTGEYHPRLADQDPQQLGFSDDQIHRLDRLIEEVETGEYGAAQEKANLFSFIDEVRPSVQEEVDRFLAEDGGQLGVFTLDEIANTRATLRATELYISEIFRWARENRGARRILLVVEEAHTIIPEMNLFRYDNSDTDAVVGRMSQIALQGRKYGVGILLVSQRTALVRKTILSQCNTYISFSLVDQTSLGYLSNVFGQQHVKLVPDLGPREIVVSGKGIDSDRPVMAKIPFDESKKQASEDLTVEWNTNEPRDDGVEGDALNGDASGAADGGDDWPDTDDDLPF